MFGFLVGLLATVAALFGATVHLNSVANDAHLAGANGEVAISCDPLEPGAYVSYWEDEPCWLVQSPDSDHSTVHTGATDYRVLFSTEEGRMRVALALRPCDYGVEMRSGVRVFTLDNEQDKPRNFPKSARTVDTFGDGGTLPTNEACHLGPFIRSSSGELIPIRDPGDTPDD